MEPAGKANPGGPVEEHVWILEAMANAGYDYALWGSWANSFSFPKKEREHSATLSMNGNGRICSNDDWGFNTQTFLSPSDMRKYVFPWHKKFVEAAHRS